MKDEFIYPEGLWLVIRSQMGFTMALRAFFLLTTPQVVEIPIGLTQFQR